MDRLKNINMEVVLIKNKKAKKCSTAEELDLLNKTDLIDRILQLEAHNSQLKRIISKNEGNATKIVKKNNKKGKQFNFSQCHKRHILLKLYYLGWDYHGFVVQDDTNNTIEHHLFEALTKACCIENRENCNYHRCGRTDKGVSALSQVISLDIRSKLSPESQDNLQEELPYCKILNRLLPRNIRCVAWAPAPNGSHDFRNICKMDVANGVVHFNRTILDAKVTLCQKDSEEASGYDMCQLMITSQAFLWHQIRCIMGILLLVGEEKEKPEVVLELLDIEKYSQKPQYNMAHEVPLNLFHCEFEDIHWFIDENQLVEVIKTLQQDWSFNRIKSTMIKSMLMDLEFNLKNDTDLRFQSNCLLQGVQSRVYQPLMKRITCESLESKIQHHIKKRKLEVKRTDKSLETSE